MALSIKDRDTERLARKLAEATGESLTTAIKRALEDRLSRLSRPDLRQRLAEEIAEIRLQCAALPVLDPRTPDEIIGYDVNGLPE